MFLFLIFSLPLALALYFVLVLPQEEHHGFRRILLRGLVMGILLWLLAGFLGGLVPAWTGTILAGFKELFARILPCAGFPLAFYFLFWRWDERIDRARLQRRMTVFWAGCLIPFPLAELLRIMTAPDLGSLLLFPAILAGLALVVPAFLLSWKDATTGQRVGLGLGAFAVLYLLSLVPTFLAARLWYLAVIVSLAFLGAALRLVLFGPAPRKAPLPLL